METTRVHTRFATIGAVSLLAGIGLLLTGFTPQSYFYGWVFWACVTFGCFGLSLLHHMAKGSWGYPVMRLLEAGGGWKMLTFVGIGFAPIAGLWMHDLYPWTHEDVASIPMVATKMPFLNLFPWFSLATFLAFIIFAYRNENWQRLQDETGDEKYLRWRTNWSSGFFPFFIMFINFAFTLWAMSMRPEWFSTMYGVWFVVQQGLTALAIVAIIVGTQAKTQPFARVVTPAFTKDIGNLLLVLTLLWAYFSFSQYLIIWSGNLPETTSYWIERRQGGFENLGAILVGFGFFVPFLMLLAPRMKRDPRNLAFVGVVILLIRFLDMHYNVAPMLGPVGGHEYATIGDAILPKIGGLLAFGGAWCLLYSRFVTSAPLLVKDQPQLQEAHDHA